MVLFLWFIEEPAAFAAMEYGNEMLSVAMFV